MFDKKIIISGAIAVLVGLIIFELARPLISKVAPKGLDDDYLDEE
jgi:hypothetical protein